jgi:plasmid stabilization system protein ParE
MSFPLIIRPEAEADLFEARGWYEEKQADLGSEFLTEIDDVFDRIGERPDLYAVEYKEVRRVALSRFPYVVYYRIVEETVEVIGVLHGSRDPKHWKSRA